MADDNGNGGGGRISSAFGFLIGQLITAGITVFAVYLAAQQSFVQQQQHTRYDDATRTVQMLHVIRAELEDNFRRVEDFAEYVDTLGDAEEVNRELVYQLSHESFDNAPQNDRYYLLNADAIIAVRSFYHEADALAEEMVVGATDAANRGGHVPPGLAKKTVLGRLTGLRDWMHRIRKALMPRLETQIANLEAVRRQAYGYDVKEIKASELISLPPLPRADESYDSSASPGNSGRGNGGGNSGDSGNGNGNGGQPASGGNSGRGNSGGGNGRGGNR